MAYPEGVKKRAIELSKLGYKSAGAILKELKRDFPADLPGERTIRSWIQADKDATYSELECNAIRDEHFAELREMVATLLDGGLDSLVNDGTAFYKFGPESLGSVFCESLPQMIEANIEVARARFGISRVDNWLVPHLKAEFPELSSLPLEDFLYQAGYDLLDRIRQLASGKPFDGVCPKCRDF